MAQAVTVEIYSTPACGFCKALKEFLDENDIEYKDYNVAEESEKLDEMTEMTDQSGVPVVLFNRSQENEEVIIGFDQARISELLSI